MLAAPDLQRLRDYRTRTQSAVTQLAETLSGTRNASLKDLHKQREQDLAEDDKAINEAEEEIRKYLQVALRMYATAIALSDEYDDSVTRMCSLWLEHASPKDVSNKRDVWNAGEISWAFYGPLRRVPSHKFVFLGPQLAARLSRPPDLNENVHVDDNRNISAKDLSSQIDGLKSDTGKRDFRVALYNLILRLALEHPFHILYQIIPLAHGYLHGGSVPTAGSTPLSSLSSSRSKGRASTQQQQQATDDGRGPAAAEILMKLQSDDNKGRLVAKQGAKDTIRFTEAAMPWCLHDDKQATSRQGRTLSVPARHAILQLRDLHMPVPTAPPPIDLTLQYSNIVTFKRYRSSYNVLGGIHRPKKMQCYDSHDKIHFELFKGNDEIRQDAVMEQVFGMANDILARDRKTKARELKYRTYIVIPLANKTGILEFVAGGLSLGEWLKPAHIR
jgi:ataxia telangiectasia mutated family protein